MIAARWALNLLGCSWSYEVEGQAHLSRVRSSGERIIYAIWHAGLLPAVWRHRGDRTTLLVSRHRDGRRFASTVAGWGFRVVHGSSTRGGSVALLGLLRALEHGNVAVTPDGPRGPARVAKPGIVAAAQRSGAVIVPVGIGASRGWRARSWDRFLVPAPFARVRMVYGEPFGVRHEASGFGDGMERLRAGLSEATRSAECG